MKAPEMIADAQVVAWAIINSEITPSGKTIHRSPGRVLGPFSRLAICRFENDVGFYLFYCDDDWQSLADTWHQSIDDAKEQAEFEYQGITAHWQCEHGDDS